MRSLMRMCGVRMWTEAYAAMPVNTTPVMPMETRQKELLAIGVWLQQHCVDWSHTRRLDK